LFTFYLNSDIVQTMKEEKTILDRITDILNFLSPALELIIGLISVIFGYLGKLIIDIAKSFHNRLVKWISGIIFAGFIAWLIYLLGSR